MHQTEQKANRPDYRNGLFITIYNNFKHKVWLRAVFLYGPHFFKAIAMNSKPILKLLLHTFLLMGIGYSFLEMLHEHGPVVLLVLLGLVLLIDIALLSRHCLQLFNQH